VAEEVKERRLAILQKLLTEQQIDFNKKFETQIMPVLFEKEAPKSRKNSSKNPIDSNKIQLWGKSPWLQSVVVEVDSQEIANNLFNKISNVEILKARPSSLFGTILNLK
jgi:tRNA A37 methylthiotransferase MiaB